MKEIKKNDTLMYIINDNFEIVFINPACKERMPDLKIGHLCYKEINGLSAPCKDCPLVSGMFSNNTFYNKKLNEWFNTDACETMFDGKKSFLLLQKPLANTTKDIFSSVLKDVSFDVLAEFNLNDGSFRLIKSHPLLKKFESGSIEDAAGYVAQEYIESFDFYRFKKFMEISNILKHFQKRNNEGLKEVFRLKSHIRSAEWVQIEILPYNLADDLSTKVLATINFIDTTSAKEKESIIEVDSLTGLVNGTAYLSRAEDFIKRHKNDNLCIASIDIDHFKIFNEWYGQTAGDLFLTDIGNKLKEFDEAYGSFSGYLGNDNFCTVIPNYEEHINNLSRILINASKAHGDGTGFLPAIGVYPIKDSNISISKMVDRSTIAASSIKDGHANRVSIYSNRMLSAIEAEYKLLHDVMESIRSDEFVIYFQPKCNIDTGKIFGAEALVRWPKDGRIIEPNAFIPTLEKTGSIIDLDVYVWEKTIMWLKSLIDRGIRPVPVSVNVSRIDLFYLDVPAIFKRLVEKHNVPSSLIELEITESAYVERLENIQRIVDDLRESGFKIALDDFGAGYSSLNVLKNISVDTLKLDIKFLDLTSDEKKGISILESVINMINSINLTIVCEGVETKKQNDILKSLGCHYVQGFYFFKPMPLANFEQFLVLGTNIDYTISQPKTIAPIKFSEFLSYLSHSDTLINNILGPVAFFSSDGNSISILKVNEKYSKLSGLENNNEILYKDKLKKSIYYEDLPKLTNLFKNAIKNPIDGSKDVIRFDKDGTLCYLEVRIFYLDERNEKRLYFSSCKDITKDKQAEEAVNLNNKKLIETLRMENIDSWEYDVREKILRIFNPTNARLKKIFNERNTIYNFPQASISEGYISPQDGKKIEGFINSVRKSRDRKLLKFELPLNIGGDLVWLKCQGKAIDNSKEVVLIVGSYRDVTDDVVSKNNNINIRALQILKENSIYASFVNLSEEKCLKINDKNLSDDKYSLKDREYSSLLELLGSKTMNFEKFKPILNSNALISEYNNHQNLINLDIKCNIEGILGKRRLTIYMYDKDGSVYAYFFLGNPDELTRCTIENMKDSVDLDNVGCGIIRMDYNSNEIFYINDTALQLYGYKTLEGFNNDLIDGFPIREYEEDKPAIIRKRANILRPGDSEPINYRIFVDDETRYLVGTETMIKVGDKQVLQRVIVDNTYDKLEDLRTIAEEDRRIKNIIQSSNHNKSILIGINKMFVSSYTCDINTNTYQAMKYTKVVSELISESKTYDEFMLNYAKRYVHSVDRLTFAQMTSRDYIKKHINYENDRFSLKYKRLVDRAYKWYKIYIIASSFDLNGKVDTIIFAIRDIDSDTKAKEDYEKKIEYYKDLFLSSSVDIYTGMLLIDIESQKCSEIKLKDHDVNETKYNELWPELLEKALGFVDEQYRNEVIEAIGEEALNKNKPGYSRIIKYKLNYNGKERFVSTTIRILEYHNTKIATLFTIDITDDIKALESAKAKSEIDELTGLFNRKKLDEYKLHGYPRISSCAVLFLDINNLKLTNDSLGHSAGDNLIKVAAASISAICNDHVYGFRYGGDEFLVIAENCSEDCMRKLITRWESALVKCNSVSKIICSMSIGYTYSDGNKSLDELILEADKIMYQSKLEYKNKGAIDGDIDNSRLSSILKYLDNDYLFIYEINIPEDRYRLLHINDKVYDFPVLHNPSYTQAINNFIKSYIADEYQNELSSILSIDSLRGLTLDRRVIKYKTRFLDDEQEFVVQAMEFEGGVCKRATLAKARSHVSFEK